MTAYGDDPTVHHIKDAQFVCTADQSAPCRNYPSCECEYWDEDHQRNHQPVPQSECWIEPWINAADWIGEVYALAEDYGWPDEHYPDGPVTVEWDGDGCLWQYADDTKPLQEIDDDA